MTDITCWGHSCVQLARQGQHLVIDPGSFSDLTVLERADAVLITHEHPDHVVPAALAEAMSARPHLRVWAPVAVTRQLIEAGAPASRVRTVADGDTFTAAGFGVQALGRDHAVIHPDITPPENVAYLIEDGVLHPGDSFTRPSVDTEVQVLFTPVTAPWLTAGAAIDYVRAVRPTIAVPVHDAIATDAGKGLVDRLVSGLGQAMEYRRLAPGEVLRIDL